MPTQTLTCASCQTDFSFSEEEQAFYESKGFSAPRKCKPCRDAAKQQRQGGGGSRYGGGGSGGGYGGGRSSYDRESRPMYDAVCSACGTQTQVPFKPTGARPIYCRQCFNTSERY